MSLWMNIRLEPCFHPRRVTFDLIFRSCFRSRESRHLKARGRVAVLARTLKSKHRACTWERWSYKVQELVHETSDDVLFSRPLKICRSFISLLRDMFAACLHFLGSDFGKGCETCCASICKAICVLQKPKLTPKGFSACSTLCSAWLIT